MPNPKNYKNEQEYMRDCMHITKQEGKSRAQGLAQCLNVWKQHENKKKMASKVASKYISASVKNDLRKVEKSNKPSIFLAGQCDEENLWRKDIIKEFKDSFIFVDPYDPEWDPSDNIYDELTGLMKVDYVIFFKGGKGSAKEKNFMDEMKKEYMEFDNLDKLKKYIDGLIKGKKSCL